MNTPLDDTLASKLANYAPGPATTELVKHTPILLLVGPTGAGKDTLKTQLLASGGYHRIISHTTRPRRENRGIMEENGREYHFIDLATAEKMLDDQAFVEAKTYSGHLYGTSATEIQAAHDKHQIALADIEVQGVAEYKAVDSSVIAVFVLPPSYEAWQNRLRERYERADMNSDDIRRRTETAKIELSEALAQDKGYFRFVINDELARAVAAVDAIAHGAPAGEESEVARALAQSLLDKL